MLAIQCCPVLQRCAGVLLAMGAETGAGAVSTAAMWRDAAHAFLSASRARPAFVEAPCFAGGRAGYVFKMGESGLGYYVDE